MKELFYFCCLFHQNSNPSQIKKPASFDLSCSSTMMADHTGQRELPIQATGWRLSHHGFLAAMFWWCSDIAGDPTSPGRVLFFPIPAVLWSSNISFTNKRNHHQPGEAASPAESPDGDFFSSLKSRASERQDKPCHPRHAPQPWRKPGRKENILPTGFQRLQPATHCLTSFTSMRL